MYVTVEIKFPAKAQFSASYTSFGKYSRVAISPRMIALSLMRGVLFTSVPIASCAYKFGRLFIFLHHELGEFVCVVGIWLLIFWS